MSCRRIISGRSWPRPAGGSWSTTPGPAAALVVARERAATATGALEREREARVAADQRADEVVAINDFLTEDLLINASPFSGGDDPTVREVLDRAAATVGERFADTPRIEASVRETIAVVYSTQGRLAEAAVHGRRAIELHEQLGDVVNAARMRVEIAGTVSSLGDIAGAEAMCRTALAVLRADAAAAAVAGRTPPDLGMPIARLAGLVAQLGRFDDAAELSAEALAILRARLPASHRSVMEVVAMYGIVLDGAGRREEAATMLGEAVRAARDAGADDEARVILESSYVGVLVQRRRYEEAAPLASEHAAIAVRTFGNGNPYTVGILNNSALVLAETAPLEEALEAATRLSNNCSRWPGRRIPTRWPPAAIADHCFGGTGDTRRRSTSCGTSAGWPTRPSPRTPSSAGGFTRPWGRRTRRRASSTRRRQRRGEPESPAEGRPGLRAPRDPPRSSRAIGHEAMQDSRGFGRSP